MSLAAESLALAFTLVNGVRALFYVPQILAVAHSMDGARDIALASWLMWVVNNLLGAAYAVVVAGDTMLALSFAASALMCALTIALTLAKRAQRRRAWSPVSRWRQRLSPTGWKD